jgi:chromosome segregation ATPase
MPPAAAPVAAAAAERRPSTAVRTETVAPAGVVAPPNARQASPPAPPPVDDTAARRERLRERLRGVREHPRPEPLPTSVAAAGVLAVERIAQLQAELNQVKQHNAALQHDLDVARRAAERATEEARGRVEEARRLAAQMEERAGLLSELERELQSVEGERDEALLAVQEARTQAAAEREQRELLTGDLARKDKELADSLSEEERLAGELERFRDDSVHLKKSVEVLSAERDTLARQVADLTAERAELLEARKALESVHRALTEAARR